MTQVKDGAAVCKTLLANLDAKAKCASVGKVAIKGLGDAETYLVKSDVVRYAVVVTANKLMWMSAPLERTVSNCGMGKCDVLDDHKSTLRSLTINNVAMPALVVDMKFHHEHSNDAGKMDTTAKWNATSVITCNGSAKAGPACSTYEWGGQGNSCSVTVKPDGNVVTSCNATDYITVE